MRTGHMAPATNRLRHTSVLTEPPLPGAQHQEFTMGLVIVLAAILLAGTVTSASLRRHA